MPETVSAVNPKMPGLDAQKAVPDAGLPSPEERRNIILRN